MIKSILALGLFISLGAQAGLICNDQNSHSIFELGLNQDLSRAKLTTLIGDSSILSVGTRELRKYEGESSATLTTFGGKTNNGHDIALLLDSARAVSLKDGQILEVEVFFEQDNSGVLSGHTELLCSKN